MRLTTTSSRYSYYLTAGSLIWLLPVAALAFTVSGDGCFQRTDNVIRATAPTCVLTFTPDETDNTIDLTVENIDPDVVTASAVGDDLTIDYNTAVTITGPLTETTVVTITPWYSITDDLWFIALSDNQAHGTVEANPIFEDMLPTINAINPPFITNSGDLVQGSDNDDTL